MKTFNTVHAQARLDHIQTCLMRQPMTANELAAEIHLTPAWTAKWMTHLEENGDVHVAEYTERKSKAGSTLKVKHYKWGPGKNAPKPAPGYPRYQARQNRIDEKPDEVDTHHEVRRDHLVAAFFGNRSVSEGTSA